MKRVIYVCVLAFPLVSCSADRMLEWSLRASAKTLDKELVALRQADRMVIDARDDARFEDRGTRDAATIRTVVAFFERYPKGWMILSGASGHYNFYLYRGGQLVGRVGLTASSKVLPGVDTLNFGDYFRRIPATEAAALSSDRRN